MDMFTYDLIKSHSEDYKKYYPSVFKVDFDKTKDFKDFVYNSRTNIAGVLKFFGCQEPENTFMNLFDSFDKRVYSNSTGFSVLKLLFQVALASSIQRIAKVQNTKDFTVDVDSAETLKVFLEQSQKSNEWKDFNKWYRGQSNFEWDLIPSFYRNIRTNRCKLIDYKELSQTYKNFGLIDKANRTIGYNSIDYNFLSFMQHSVSFSPLIDFSYNPFVAATMALSDTDNFREHYSNDSAIFDLYLANDNKDKVVRKQDEVDYIIRNFNVYYSNSFPFMDTIEVRGNKLQISNIDNLCKALTPEYILIDIPTNDRMRYQSGRFILFYDCLIVGTKVYAELAKGLSLTKYKLDKSLKQRSKGSNTILEIIEKEYPEYSYNNLMNPYDWFGK